MYGKKVISVILPRNWCKLVVFDGDGTLFAVDSFKSIAISICMDDEI